MSTVTMAAVVLLFSTLLAGCPELTDKEDDPSGCEGHADCADTLPCTSDRCGSDGACLNVVSGDWCQINGQCVAGKVANPSNSCEVCSPLVSPKAWSAVPDGTSCDDGLACTFNDSCSVGSCAGTNYSCDDKLDCTIDSCTGLTPLATKGCTHDVKAGTCLIAGACHNSGDKNTQSSCDRCDPATSKTAWSAVACCGDGTRDSGEQCDTADLNSMTCAKLGFASGGLTCKSDCSFDTSGCAGGGSGTSCGNGALDYGEACDGTKLGGMTCVKLGYASGTLGCAASCTYNIATCVQPTGCGNGKLETSEQCDGAKLGGATCSSQGFTAGTLGCLFNCSYDYSLCSQCGNNVKEASEVCDGPVTGATCITQGLNAGVLGCDAQCSYDTSGCGWALGLGDLVAPSSVALDAAGNSYVAGNFSSSVTLGGTTHSGSSGKNVFVAKYDPSGKLLWSTIGTGGAGVTTIAVSGGSVYITGWIKGSGLLGGKTMAWMGIASATLAARLDTSSGFVHWVKSFGKGGQQIGNGVAVSGAGDVYVVGDFWSQVALPGGSTVKSNGWNDIFVLKLSSAGQHLATGTYGSSGDDSGAAITTDMAGNVYVTGFYSAAVSSTPSLPKPQGKTDILVVRLNSALKATWVGWGGSTGDDKGKGIVHADSGLFVAGTMQGELTIPDGQTFGGTKKVTYKGTGSDIMMVRFLSKNAVFGNWGFAIAGNGVEQVGALTAGPTGKLYLTGTLGSSSVAFGGTTLKPADGRAFLARFSGSTFDWAKNFGGGSGVAYDLAVGLSGVIHGVGSFIPGTPGAAFSNTTLKTGRTYILKVAKP